MSIHITHILGLYGLGCRISIGIDRRIILRRIIAVRIISRRTADGLESRFITHSDTAENETQEREGSHQDRANADLALILTTVNNRPYEIKTGHQYTEYRENECQYTAALFEVQSLAEEYHNRYNNIAEENDCGCNNLDKQHGNLELCLIGVTAEIFKRFRTLFEHTSGLLIQQRHIHRSAIDITEYRQKRHTRCGNRKGHAKDHRYDSSAAQLLFHSGCCSIHKNPPPKR